VGARHGHEVNGIAIFTECALTIALVVAEAVLHTDDNPGDTGSEGEAKQTRDEKHRYHKLVKTTPKPRATKNRRGELVGPLPPPEEPVLVADAEIEEEAALGTVDVVADIWILSLNRHTTVC
jgi:hypothetical protein